MKEIKLTQGLFAQVDDEDYERVNELKWYASKGLNTFYARTNIRVNGKQKTIRMHRFILNIFESTILIDHENRNGLNCQRSNMRQCTPLQNQMNSIEKSHKTSKYKGVSFHKNVKRYMARITVLKHQNHLGSFKTEEEAAEKYNEAAIKYFGEFARLNII